MQLVEPAVDCSDNNAVAAILPTSSLSWTYSASSGQTLKQILLGACVVVTAVSAYLLFRLPLVALGAGAVVFFSVADSVLPLTYRLSPDGATVRLGPIDIMEMPTDSIKSVYSSGTGIKLSAFVNHNDTFMEPFRGVMLRFPRDRSAEILHFLDSAWGLRP